MSGLDSYDQQAATNLHRLIEEKRQATRTPDPAQIRADALSDAGYGSTRAIPIAPQPADPLSDPRVVVLVEALRCYEDQLCEGFCADMPDKSLTSSAMENDCGGCKARAALRAIGGEA